MSISNGLFPKITQFLADRKQKDKIFSSIAMPLFTAEIIYVIKIPAASNLNVSELQCG